MNENWSMNVIDGLRCQMQSDELDQLRNVAIFL